MIVSKKPDCVS